MNEPRVKALALLPIRIGQVWKRKGEWTDNGGNQAIGREWTVISVGPEFCLLRDYGCESHLILKIVNVYMWLVSFEELLKGF